MGKNTARAAVVGLGMALSAGAARAAIATHFGISKPADEGFTPVADFGAYESFDANDGGLNVPAWQLSKPITSVQKGYEYVLTNSEAQEAANLGWLIRARIRVANLDDSPDYSVSVLYSNGLRRFDMLLGSTAGGDPIVKLANSFTGDGENAIGPTFTDTGGGAGFHTYEMRFDPNSQGVDLFIDGTECLSDYLGNQVFVASPRLDFGAFGAEGTGDGRYNEVSIALAPEPSLALAAVAPLLYVKFMNPRSGRANRGRFGRT